MRTAVNGVDLYVSQQGRGAPALVFLHYFGGSSRAWDGVVRQLRAQYRCIAIDQRGFGNSSAPRSGYAVRDYATDVEALIAVLGLGRYVLIGHSMGGKFAMAVAARRPPGLEALFLVDPSPPTPEPMSDSTRKHLLASHGDRAAMIEIIRGVAVSPLPKGIFDAAVEDNLRSSRAAWRAWLDGGSREDIAGEMASVLVPALVLRGAEDPVMSRHLLEREVVGRIRGSRMIEIPAAGHLLPLRAPVEIAALILSFLAESPLPAPAVR